MLRESMQTLDLSSWPQTSTAIAEKEFLALLGQRWVSPRLDGLGKLELPSPLSITGRNLHTCVTRKRSLTSNGLVGYRATAG